MNFVRTAELTAIKERLNTNRRKLKQYVFVLDLEWSDGSSSVVWRSYSEFFELQCRLLDAFPEESGNVRGSIRSIPFLPGRKIFKKSDLTLAQERQPEIETYVKELLALEPKISRSSLVSSFFQRRQNDPEYFNQFPLQLNSPAATHDVSVLPSVAFKSQPHGTDKTADGETNESFVDSGDISQAVMLNSLELCKR